MIALPRARRFTDISPLTALSALMSLSIPDNSLDQASCCTHIPALEDAGAFVYFANSCDAHTCP